MGVVQRSQKQQKSIIGYPSRRIDNISAKRLDVRARPFPPAAPPIPLGKPPIPFYSDHSIWGMLLGGKGLLQPKSFFGFRTRVQDVRADIAVNFCLRFRKLQLSVIQSPTATPELVFHGLLNQ